MSAEQTKNVVRMLIDAFNERQFDTLAGSVFSPDLMYTQNGRRGDLNKWLQDSRNCVATFPDARLVIDSHEVMDGQVITRITFTGTHLGSMGEIPPTGKSFNIHVTTTTRAENGLIIDYDEQVDEMALMQQLGLGMGAES